MAGGVVPAIHSMPAGRVIRKVQQGGTFSCHVEGYESLCTVDHAYSCRTTASNRAVSGETTRPSRSRISSRVPTDSVKRDSPQHERGRDPSYLSCCRRTISVIQVGANGDVQFGGVG